MSQVTTSRRAAQPCAGAHDCPTPPCHSFESSLPPTLTSSCNQQPAFPNFLISTAVVLPFRLHFFTSMEETRMSELLSDCQDVGCTWPCAHHVHRVNERYFYWYPDLQRESEGKVGLKDCQFCQIFFNIRQSDCYCGANSHNDHILEGGSCRYEYARCFFRSNGNVFVLDMRCIHLRAWVADR